MDSAQRSWHGEQSARRQRTGSTHPLRRWMQPHSPRVGSRVWMELQILGFGIGEPPQSNKYGMRPPPKVSKNVSPGEPLGRESLLAGLWGAHLSTPSLRSTGSRPGQGCSQGTLAMTGDIFGCTTWEVLLASSGRRPGILLNNAQDRSPQQRIIQPPVSIVLRMRNPALENELGQQ